jgi:hypothetical protein
VQNLIGKNNIFYIYDINMHVIAAKCLMLELKFEILLIYHKLIMLLINNDTCINFELSIATLSFMYKKNVSNHPC